MTLQLLRALYTRMIPERVRGVLAGLRQQSSVALFGDPFTDYRVWARGTRLKRISLLLQRRQAKLLAYRPVFSLLAILDGVDADRLSRSVRSLQRQTYPHWELCLVTHTKSSARSSALVERFAASDSRIKIQPAPGSSDGCSAWGRALAMATGEFVVPFSLSDRLAPQALFAVARLLNDHPETDLVYTDEDRFRSDGERVRPFLKPDWAPEYFFSFPYVGRLAAYRRSLLDGLASPGPGYDRDIDNALVFRVLERSGRIRHLDQVLYHADLHPSPESHSAAVPAYDAARFQQSLSDYVKWQGMAATCEPGLRPGTFRIRYAIVGDPLVSMVIITAGGFRDVAGRRIDLLANFVRSIIRKTAYKKYEIICVHNGDLRRETTEALENLGGASIRLVTYDRPLNIAEKYNLGARHARGEHLLFLNDDLEVISEEWLSAMLEFSQQDAVGAVGAKLLYPDGSIQHAGVAVRGSPGHIYYQRPGDCPGDFFDTVTIRNYSAVTGACVMSRRRVFDEVGGFTEAFPINFNDVDYCLKIRDRGYRIVFTPYAQLVHFESMSREARLNPGEMDLLNRIWGEKIHRDPYCNPLFRW